jgi:deoxyribodipyrimidine photo-lyase
MRTLIHWFRRDLRLDDNTALIAALQQADTVVPVFVLDPAILARPDTGRSRLAFLVACLGALDERLRQYGSHLVIRRGVPAVELTRLVREVAASGLTFNRDSEPYARQRDATVRQALTESGCSVLDYSDQGLNDPTSVLKADGQPYTVFTPYRRRALEALPSAAAIDAVPYLHRLASAATLPASQPLPEPPRLGHRQLPEASEAAALARLKRFSGETIGRYSVDRHRPAVDGTARLSPYLKFGVLSVRRCLQLARQAGVTAETAEARAGVDTWINQLIWRDFYAQILFHFPRVEATTFRPGLTSLAWSDNAEHLAAWQAGRTGYPLVDAGMRQLATEAWLHNRLRLVVASFLCKDLLVNWQAGERHFMACLLDGDLAANNGGWQWVASTGTDALPYFRIFNPTSQSQRFDPDGIYIRRYVPELAAVPAAYLHAPATMPLVIQRQVGCRIGVDYPAPIVDHATQRPLVLALYRRGARPGHIDNGASSDDQPQRSER